MTVVAAKSIVVVIKPRSNILLTLDIYDLRSTKQVHRTTGMKDYSEVAAVVRAQQNMKLFISIKSIPSL